MTNLFSTEKLYFELYETEMQHQNSSNDDDDEVAALTEDDDHAKSNDNEKEEEKARNAFMAAIKDDSFLV
jgi:hypothetical protein